MAKKIVQQALTYDDVLLIPAASDIAPRDVDVTTQLTPSIKLNIPLVSAAMDTITETDLAIALAREGGIGILHKNLSIEQQADMVTKVKRSESATITDPLTLTPGHTVKDARELMIEHGISGIPIVDNKEKLKGIITNRDLRLELSETTKLEKIMSTKLVTAPVGTTLKKAKQILHENKIEKLLIVDKKGVLYGLVTFRDIAKAQSYPNACKDDSGHLRVGAAVGVTGEALKRVDALVKSGVDVIVTDSAHGHAKAVLKAIKEIRSAFPKLDIISGNLVTAEAALDSIKAGATAVKVGVGPGSICTTRIISGVGVPQLTAVMNVVEAAKKKGIPVIADGGIKQTGDVAKAIGAGASSVMLGNMFAGVEEAPGKTIILNGQKYKAYRGMGSEGAMKEGTRDRYFQDNNAPADKLVPEGIEGRVAYRGTLHEITHQVVGGLRSGMGYCGAKNIKAMQKDAQFTQITSASMAESHPHHVQISEQSSNYWE